MLQAGETTGKTTAADVEDNSEVHHDRTEPLGPARPAPESPQASSAPSEGPEAKHRARSSLDEKTTAADFASAQAGVSTGNQTSAFGPTPERTTAA